MATDSDEKPSSRNKTHSSCRFLTYAANVYQRLFYDFTIKTVVVGNFFNRFSRTLASQ